MDCREFLEFLMNYLDGELEEGQRSVFEQHMFVCPPCGDYLKAYEDTIRLGRFACKDSVVPEDVPEELVSAILAARRA